MNADTKQHWETVYKTKSPEEVSWTQPVPQTSLNFIHSFGLHKSARLIDIGGGDSRLVDFLLDEGFENITVLDISAAALHKARQRLGRRAHRVNWIVSDVLDFAPAEKFDLWHDRAAFHFLTQPAEIAQYMETARKAVTGFLTLGTFSDRGPTMCSGLQIKQYTEATLSAELQNGFEKIRCITENHLTPFRTTQNFLFCSFKRHPN